MSVYYNTSKLTSYFLKLSITHNFCMSTIYKLKIVIHPKILTIKNPLLLLGSCSKFVCQSYRFHHIPLYNIDRLYRYKFVYIMTFATTHFVKLASIREWCFHLFYQNDYNLLTLRNVWWKTNANSQFLKKIIEVCMRYWIWFFHKCNHLISCPN